MPNPELNETSKRQDSGAQGVAALPLEVPVSQVEGVDKLSTDLNLVVLYQSVHKSIFNISAVKPVTVAGQHMSRETDGTAFAVREDGMLVTDLHVVEGASKVTAWGPDGKRFSGDVIDTDPEADLALIKLHNPNKGNRFFPLRFTDRPGPFSASEVYGLGFRSDQRLYLSPGHLMSSVLRRDFDADTFMPLEDRDRIMLRSKMRAERRSSGGPLVNQFGEVVGVIGYTNRTDRVYSTPLADVTRLLNKH